MTWKGRERKKIIAQMPWPLTLLTVTKSSVSLYTSAKSNLRDRVLGEVEKDSFITLPGKGGHNGFLISFILLSISASFCLTF